MNLNANAKIVLGCSIVNVVNNIEHNNAFHTILKRKFHYTFEWPFLYII